MRIVHAVDYLMPTLGYQEMLLPKWNARHGHETHIVTSDRYSLIPNYDQIFGPLLGPRILTPGTTTIEGVQVHRLPTRIEFSGRVWLAGLTRKIAELAPDAVFVHGTSSPMAVRLAWWAKRARVALIMDNHMTFSSRRHSLAGRGYYPLLRWITRTVLVPGSYRFVGVAQECCDFLAQAQAVPAERIEMLPLGIDPDLFHPDDAAGAAFRRENGIPANARVVLQTGKITPDKGADLLAEAMAPLMATAPDIVLLLVGSGPPAYIARVREKLNTHGVADRLVIHPLVPVEKLAGVFAAADLCVFARAASLSCLEAAACARPVLMSDMPIGRWRASMGVGLTFAAEHVSDLRAVIAAMLGDAEARQRLGQAARQSVAAHFSYDVIASQSEKLLDRARSALRTS